MKLLLASLLIFVSMPAQTIVKLRPGSHRPSGARRIANDTYVVNTVPPSGVVYSEPDSRVRAAVLDAVGVAGVNPWSPDFPGLWGMKAIEAPLAHRVSNGSRGIGVAVIDTGIDYNHPELSDNVWRAPRDFTVRLGDEVFTCPAGTRGVNVIRYPAYKVCDPMDDLFHGTHVAGTIGAVGFNGSRVTGVVNAATIVPIKFLDFIGSGSISDSIIAVNVSMQIQAQFPELNLRILSNSWGGGAYSEALKDAIEEAGRRGMLFVAAAGNSGVDADVSPQYPASYRLPNVVSVAATDETDLVAYFSNYGHLTVHLAAPGVNVVSSVPRGYDAYSGTSMATPHVSGVALLVLSECPGLSPEQLKALLVDTAEPMYMADWTAAGGRLDAYTAVRVCRLMRGN